MADDTPQDRSASLFPAVPRLWRYGVDTTAQLRDALVKAGEGATHTVEIVVKGEMLFADHLVFDKDGNMVARLNDSFPCPPWGMPCGGGG